MVEDYDNLPCRPAVRENARLGQWQGMNKSSKALAHYGASNSKHEEFDL